MISVLFLNSCATKKRKGEPSALSKFYHNTTAKYNGYFNANELLKASFVSLETQNQDNYNKLLHVYPYSASSNPGAVSQDLDIAIEKVTTVALLHEPSKWVDDCYLLMGKAQFLKQDYETAEETFEYFQEEFDPKNPNGRMYNKNKGKKSPKQKKKEKEQERKEKKEEKDKERKEREKEKELKKKKREEEKKDRKKRLEERRKNKKRGAEKQKEDKKKAEEEKKRKEAAEKKAAEDKARKELLLARKEERKKREEEEKKKKEQLKPEGGGLFGHTPAFYEGVLWEARTYIERANYYTAEYLLNKLEKEYPISDDVRKEIYPARAHLYIQQKQYDDAIEALEIAMEKSGDKKRKARYAFIQAQLHQLNGDRSSALASFERVKKFKPSFEMEFNTKLNIEKSRSGKGSIDKLNKMLKEAKYDEFNDQIHYAIGEVKLNSGDIPGAIESFENSLAVSSNNTTQKTETYYKLASLYYDTEKYVPSKLYYDSTLVVMDKLDERKPIAEKYAKGLTDIAKNISIIELQDSLLRIGQMSKEEQREFAKKVLEEERNRVEIADANNGQDDKFKDLASNSSRGPRGFSPYFAYNKSAVRKGKQAFLEKWDNRKLEDNWRRSNRSDANTTDAEEEEELIVNEDISDGEIDGFLKGIPNNPPKRKAAEAKLSAAMFELGTLFRDRIQNYEKSIVTLESYVNRFPQEENELDALYYIYLDYLDLNNSAQAKKYKDLISSKFPDTKYARALNDPNFSDELKSQDMLMENNYNEVYALFEAGQYQQVSERVKEINGNNTTADLLPKYSLLEAMCIGNLEGKESYISALGDVIAKHPNTPESTRAKEIKRFLSGDSDAFDKALYEEELELFELEEEKLHYVILVVYEATNKKVNEIKIALSDYHKKYHKLDKLKITDIYLNVEEKAKVILIRKFRNKDKAMSYFNNTKKNSKDYINNEETPYDIFAISQKNYREVIKQKSVVQYRSFFDKKYQGL